MQDQATQTPEAGIPATWYGSAVHDAIEAVEDGHTDEAAIEATWATWGSHLDAEALTLLKDDLEKYHERDGEFGATRTVLSEGEVKVPLTELDDGTPVFFRARIDRLYERLEAPGHFIHVDYKSSKWIKSQDEVDEDPQLWAYNWVICEYFPECEDLEQWLDQLRGGMVSTRKSAEQRDEIREWLAIEARNYFAEHETMEDGLPAPRFNQWCPWCPIMESCDIVPRLSNWALTRIATLCPDVPAAETLATVTTPVGDYIEQYDDAQTAIKVLERYADSVKQLVRDADEGTRAELGFELRDRRNSVLGVRARKALYESLGHDRFMDLARITQERLKTIEDPEQKAWALGLVEKIPGQKVVTRRRS